MKGDLFGELQSDVDYGVVLTMKLMRASTMMRIMTIEYIWFNDYDDADDDFDDKTAHKLTYI